MPLRAGETQSATTREDYSDDEREFLAAVAAFRQRTGKQFPSLTELLGVLRSLGWSKGGAPEAPPAPAPAPPPPARELDIPPEMRKPPGRKGTPPERLEEIRAALRSGETWASVIRRLRVARYVVADVATGRR